MASRSELMMDVENPTSLVDMVLDNRYRKVVPLKPGDSRNLTARLEKKKGESSHSPRSVKKPKSHASSP